MGVKMGSGVGEPKASWPPFGPPLPPQNGENAIAFLFFGKSPYYVNKNHSSLQWDLETMWKESKYFLSILQKYDKYIYFRIIFSVKLRVRHACPLPDIPCVYSILEIVMSVSCTRKSGFREPDREMGPTNLSTKVFHFPKIFTILDDFSNFHYTFGTHSLWKICVKWSFKTRILGTQHITIWLEF